MAKLKTRKSVTKRFKVTRTGKILRRPTGQDHYRSKQTGKQKRQGRKWVPLSVSEVRAVKKLLHR